MVARRLLRVAALALLFFPLGGCQDRSAEEQSGPRRITVAYYSGVPMADFVKEEIPAFTEATGIQVDFQEIRYTELRQRLVQAFDENRADFDAVFVDDIWMYEFVRKGYLERLDSLVGRDSLDLSDFFPVVRAAESEMDGHVWLIPQRADVQVLFYRLDLFEDPGVRATFQQTRDRPLTVPDTWEEYQEVATFFTEIGESYTPRLWGSGETLLSDHYAFEFFALRYWAYSDTTFLEGSIPIFDSPSGRQALEALVALREIAAPSSPQWDHAGTIGAFSGGFTAMAPQWYANFVTLVRDTAVAGKLGVALVPGVRRGEGITRTPSIGGGSLGIPSDSRMKAEAWEFIKHMTSGPFLARLALEGAIVPRRSAYQDPRVREAFPAVDVYLQSLDIARFRPRLTQYAQVEDKIGEAVSAAFAEGGEPGRFLTSAAEEIRVLLSSGGG